MWNCIEYLKDPYLVVKIQRFYGIHRAEPSEHEENCGSKSNINHSACRDRICDEKSSCLKTDLSKVIKHNQNGVVLRSNKVYASDHEDIVSSESETETKSYVIKNWFWYYVFVFGTELGDEIFYATFIPFWFWNIDGAVGRRIVMVWTIIMYIGQGIKDVVCLPRPASPPVFRLQKKWEQEYGMPSTHAMVGVSIPFSVVLYTFNRYQYPLFFGLFIAILWCAVMSVSRLYLGMHSVLDIVAGLLLALVLMIPVVPMVDSLDHILLTNKWTPLVLVIVSILLIAYYPKGKGHWTPTRGDTTLVISVCVGVIIGAWTNYQLGEMQEPSLPPPYNVIWPSYGMIGLGALRTVIGMCCIVGTRALCKSIYYAVLHYRESKTSNVNREANKEDNHNINESMTTAQLKKDNVKLTIDLCSKYLTYIMIGFITLYLLPKVFRILRIERPTFYTEM